MLWSALINTIKGSYDTVALRAKLQECKEILQRDDLAELEPYQRFFALERLLAAEYMIKLSKLRAQGAGIEEKIALQEKVNCKMAELIQKTQKELEARNATKLDIARLVANLREISIAVDRDMLKLRNEIVSEQKKQKLQIHDLEDKINIVADKIARDIKEVRDYIEQRDKLTKEQFNKLEKELHNIEEKSSTRAILIWMFNLIIFVAFLFLFFK